MNVFGQLSKMFTSYPCSPSKQTAKMLKAAAAVAAVVAVVAIVAAAVVVVGCFDRILNCGRQPLITLNAFQTFFHFFQLMSFNNSSLAISFFSKSTITPFMRQFIMSPSSTALF